MTIRMSPSKDKSVTLWVRRIFAYLLERLDGVEDGVDVSDDDWEARDHHAFVE